MRIRCCVGALTEVRSGVPPLGGDIPVLWPDHSGRCRAGEIENLIHFNKDGMRDVVTQQLEALVIEKMLDIAPRSREEIIDAKDLVPSRQELLAEMGAKKSSASGN